MAKVNVGSRTYAWGSDIEGLKLDPKSEGNIVLTPESSRPVIEALGRSGFKSSPMPAEYDAVFYVDGTGGMRRVVIAEDDRYRAEDRNPGALVREAYFPLAVWRTDAPDADPLAPVPGETPEEREARERAGRTAVRESDARAARERDARERANRLAEDAKRKS